ncbi:hypothetical protein [Parvularcula lutaonensis]|uniref:1,4-alpha-glucan branching enzyme n=1 Tax=Parvularcula lutaonensis TaxID=491923 RepID=A0ABV7M9C3_9PROT|nr:hypothetical protein [Parvularcula lutaonensis]GGY46810.1 hypothetical protein GCM10007148_14930 [Parvularcula lutaonensis]
MSEAIKTTDHDTIKSWAEARGGQPAFVGETLNDEQKGVILKIKFQDEDNLETVSWDTFFDHFEEKNLAALLQDETSDGSKSRFVKFIDRSSQ